MNGRTKGKKSQVNSYIFNTIPDFLCFALQPHLSCVGDQIWVPLLVESTNTVDLASVISTSDYYSR